MPSVMLCTFFLYPGYGIMIRITADHVKNLGAVDNLIVSVTVPFVRALWPRIPPGLQTSIYRGKNFAPQT